MPLMLSVIDDLAKVGPVSSVYLALWCRRSSKGVVSVTDEKEMALFSGLSGQRGKRTWRARVEVLTKLGFVSTNRDEDGTVRQIILHEPVKVIKRLAAQSAVGRNAKKYEALLAG